MEPISIHSLLKRIAERFTQEQDRWFLWTPVFLGCGISYYFALPYEPLFHWGVSLLFAISVLFFLLRQSLIPRLLCQVIFWFSLGWIISQGRAQLLNTPILQGPVKPLYFWGDIQNIEMRPDGQRIRLENIWIPKDSWPQQQKHPHAIRFVLRGKLQPKEPLLPGQRISVKVGLNPPGGPVVPGGFDFRRQAYFQRLSAVGFAVSSPKVRHNHLGWNHSMARWRLQLTKRIRNELPEKTGPIASALITGDRSGISDQLRQSFADAGLAHILAISGLHLNILAGLAFFGLRRGLCLIPAIALDYPIKKWAAAATIFISFGYLVLCGQSIPATRAFLMTTLMMIAILLERPALSMHNVSVAALFLLLGFPEILTGASFQLSFAAVIALIAVYESKQLKWEHAYTKKGSIRRLWMYIGGILGTSLIASLATAPFGIYHFGRFPLYGILSNLIAVPLTTLWIMPMAILSVAGIAIGKSTLPLHGLDLGISWLIDLAEFVSSWSQAVFLTPSIPITALAFFTIGSLWICLWSQSWRWWGLVGWSLSLFICVLSPPPDIYVSQTGKVIGIRSTDKKLWTTTLHCSRFLKESWQRHAGVAGSQRLPYDQVALQGRVFCTRHVCRYLHHGHRVLLTRTPDTIDKRAYDLCLNVTGNPKVCPNSNLQIDLAALNINGAHCIWLPRGGPVRFMNTHEQIGERLWTRNSAN